MPPGTSPGPPSGHASGTAQPPTRSSRAWYRREDQDMMARSVRSLVLALAIEAALTGTAAGEETATRARPAEPRHTNRLVNSANPYLLLHAHNPVDWYPWGPEALARARKEDKPIFLSVGYSTCFWCHVAE